MIEFKKYSEELKDYITVEIDLKNFNEMLDVNTRNELTIEDDIIMVEYKDERYDIIAETEDEETGNVYYSILHSVYNKEIGEFQADNSTPWFSYDETQEEIILQLMNNFQNCAKTD